MRRPAGWLKKENHPHARTPPPTHKKKTYRHPGVGAPDPQELGRLGGDQALKVVRPGGPHGVRPLAVKAGERGEGAGEGAARARQGRRGRWETKKKTIHPSAHTFLWSPDPARPAPGLHAQAAGPACAGGYGAGRGKAAPGGGVGGGGHCRATSNAGGRARGSFSLSLVRSGGGDPPPPPPLPPAHRLFLRTSFMEVEAVEVTPMVWRVW